jgi:DNA-binding NarL/FixJ family response regulator
MTALEATLARMHELARIENVRAGLSATPPESWTDRRVPPPGAGRPPEPRVAERRRKVMLLAAAGVPDRVIAIRLGLKTATVKSDLYLMRKRATE